MGNPTAPDNQFVHEPLPDPAKYIRLLEVLDDNHSDTIVRCSLTTWLIDSAPPYHAISYTWGDPESNTFILLNDRALKVRTNCEFALKQAYWYQRKRLYWPRKRRFYYWIDSVCIDQTNLGEKSHQVSLMGNIYKNASHVLACIGDHYEDSLLFFKKLYGLKRRVVPVKGLFRTSRCIKCFGVSTRFRLVHRYSTTLRFVLALAHLAMRPYFTRLWVLQELQNAQNITILCGKDILGKEHAISLFYKVAFAHKEYDEEERRGKGPCNIGLINGKFQRRIVNHGLPHSIWHGDWLGEVWQRSKVTSDMLSKDTMKWSTYSDFFNKIVCRLECAEPKDKLYGIISLIKWGDVAAPLPDYKQSDFNVAIEFLEAFSKLPEARERDGTLWGYLIITIKMLSLDIRSRGLEDALEARRGPPRDSATRPAEVRGEGFTIEFRERAWQLLDEDFENNESRLRNLQSSPPVYPDDCTFLLPRWARAGDWAIPMEPRVPRLYWYKYWDPHNVREAPYVLMLIMREDGSAGSNRNVLIGYGFYEYGRGTLSFMGSNRGCFHPEYDKKAKWVDLNINIEDGIICLLKIKQLNEVSTESNEWMSDFLETGVCRHQSPGSSYGSQPYYFHDKFG